MSTREIREGTKDCLQRIWKGFMKEVNSVLVILKRAESRWRPGVGIPVV